MLSHRPSRLAAARLGSLWGASCAAVVMLACLLAAAAQDAPAGRVDETSALISKELDKTIDLAVANRPLPDVLREIEDKTGVPFLVTDETYALLPWGRETPINVNGKATLRQTLDLIGGALGLEYVLRKENVELRPLPALQRSGRRATVQDLAGLDLLRSTRLSLPEDRPTVAGVLEAIDLKLAEQDRAASQRNEPPPGFQVENRLDETLRQRPVFVARNATMLGALEAIAEQTSATWFPWGDSFIVLPKEQWVRRRLDAPINVSSLEIDVEDALYELQRASGVAFTIEPGALQHVPEKYRRIHLYVPEKSVRDALQSLSGITGLGYTVTDDGIHIYHAASGLQRPVPGGPQAERPAVLVPLGNGTSLLLYPDELPRDLREQLDARRQQAIEALRESLPSPATEPSN